MKKIVPSLNDNDAETFARIAEDVCNHYEINTPLRFCAFIGNVDIESQHLTKKSENMNYSKIERIVEIFKSRVDTDHDKVVEADEIEHAKKYVRKPEALANFVYANREGNGNEASGDGYRFRAGGFMGITFKNMFQAYATYLGTSIEDAANKVRTENYYAFDSAAWVWAVVKKLNDEADRGEFKKCCVAINGGLTAYNERLEVYERAKSVFGI